MSRDSRKKPRQRSTSWSHRLVRYLMTLCRCFWGTWPQWRISVFPWIQNLESLNFLLWATFSNFFPENSNSLELELPPQWHFLLLINIYLCYCIHENCFMFVFQSNNGNPLPIFLNRVRPWYLFSVLSLACLHLQNIGGVLLLIWEERGCLVVASYLIRLIIWFTKFWKHFIQSFLSLWQWKT